ncbi:MAG: winged helix-turn-helix transcriptional regulator [Colwellia sp.]|nr:winged helix-turn-helix transcriptional regulator [Colwellia sp.]
MDYNQLEANAEKATKLLKTMGNQHRLMILCALQQGELSVSQLNELFPIAQSTLSQHLAWLRRESYVKTRRDAQTIYYTLDSHAVIEIIAVLHKLYCD